MYYAPAGQCEIVSTNGKVTWNLSAAATMGAGDAKVYPFLTGITVTIARNKISALEVTIDAPYEEGILMLYEDSGGGSPFNANNLVRTRIGYADMNQWTPWYQGQLAAGGDGLSISPTGVGGSVSAQQFMWSDAYVPMNTQWTADRPSALLDKLALAMGRELDLGTGAAEVLERAAAAFGPRTTWCTGGKTFTEAVEWLCRQLGLTWGLLDAGMNFGKGNVGILYVRSNNEVQTGTCMAARPRNRYVMRGPFAPQINQYPILSWGPDPGLSSWLGEVVRGSNSGMAFRGMDKRTGTSLGFAVTPLESPDAIYGAAANKGAAQDRTDERGVQLDKATKPGQVEADIHAGPVPDSDTAEQAARTQVNARMTEGSVACMATLTTIGVPGQMPFDLIDVVGCSPRFDGPYEVMEVTHRFSPGTYETELKVQRRGTFGTDEPAPATATQGGQVPAKG